MINYNKNKLINECLGKYYETFARTLDTADFVPAEYNDKINAYIFKNMKLKDIYSVMEMAKKGVEADGMRRKNQFAVTYNEWERWVIRFRMNSGKVVYRTYYIPMEDEIKEIRDSIHDSVEYKQGVYPILGQTASDTAKVYFPFWNLA